MIGAGEPDAGEAGARRVPVNNGEERQSDMDKSSFRQVMRLYPGAVTVIAVGAPGDRTGTTATSVCSLSDEPPLILACINRNASAHDLIQASKCFCVNVLAFDQSDIALRFAGQAGLSGEARFEADRWDVLKTGAPVLKGALASLDCSLEEEMDGRTHTIFIGRVRDACVRADAEPLLYYSGSFRTLAKADA